MQTVHIFIQVGRIGFPRQTVPATSTSVAEFFWLSFSLPSMAVRSNNALKYTDKNLIILGPKMVESVYTKLLKSVIPFSRYLEKCSKKANQV